MFKQVYKDVLRADECQRYNISDSQVDEKIVDRCLHSPVRKNHETNQDVSNQAREYQNCETDG